MTLSVHFDDDNLCIYHSGAVMDFDEACTTDIWYQYTDLQYIKKKAMILSREANRIGLGSLLTDTYGKTDYVTQASINQWVLNGSSRRGLERFINDEYSIKRSDLRRRTIKSVLRAQRKMKEEGIDDIEYCTKVLSRLSEAFSLDSRNFALLMGQADALALEDNNNENTCIVAKENIHDPSVFTKNHHNEQRKSQQQQQQYYNAASGLPLNNRVLPQGRGFTQYTRPGTHRNLGLSGNVVRSTNDFRHYC